MEVYKSETREVIKRFLDHKLDFAECIAALDAALADLVSRLRPEELHDLRVVMMANNEKVMKEMETRERYRKAKAQKPQKKRNTAKP